MPQQVDSNRTFMSTAEASQASGLSKTYIQQLLHAKLVEGIKLGHDWLVYQDSLDAFLAQPRKPGRKGPLQVSPAVQQEHQGRVLLTTTQACEQSGFSRDHLLDLLRSKRIEGFKPHSRSWLVYEDALQRYLAQSRKRTTTQQNAKVTQRTASTNAADTDTTDEHTH